MFADMPLAIVLLAGGLLALLVVVEEPRCLEFDYRHPAFLRRQTSRRAT